MKITDLYKPMTLPAGANIDTRYWTDNGDGTYTPTALLIYTIARDATEYFKKVIAKLDKEEPAVTQYGNKPIVVGDYHFREANVKIVDTYENDMLKREYELKYGEQLKEVDKKWKAYQRSHPDEFTVTTGVQVVKQDHDENSYINNFKIEDLGLSLQDAVAAASAAMSLLAKYKSDGEKFSELPLNTFDTYRSKKEYAEKHRTIRQSYIDEFNIPVLVQIDEEKLPVTTGYSEPKFYKKSYTDGVKNPKPGTITIENFDEKILRTTPDEETFGKYAAGLIGYITSTTKEDYLKSLSDKLSTVGEEFVEKFNEVSKEFKAVDTAAGYEIFTKGTPDKSPEKYIDLVKQTDEYDCVLQANIDGIDISFRGTVKKYGDFKKILQIFAKILDSAGVKDKAEDLTEIIATL